MDTFGIHIDFETDALPISAHQLHPSQLPRPNKLKLGWGTVRCCPYPVEEGHGILAYIVDFF
ncbi:hypothetical protein BDA96_10G292500 [Sorghum bicolor]|uniref:Uncharacterized protein n=1 Tax=Sorghum bicolor TaxID=4558 RepID=A0A921Q7Z0_SORBI|nr:hypothetical protein BDA96_10G292500 [Sorghum bicolor]